MMNFPVLEQLILRAATLSAFELLHYLVIYLIQQICILHKTTTNELSI